MKIKKYVVGFVAGVLVGSMSVGAFAATGSQTIKATYKNIKVAVNNSVVALKDANGKTVEPFVVNGTTYLPVRGVATALGQEVSWDASTNTVYIGEQPSNNTVSKSTPANTVICDQNGIKVTYIGYKRNDGYVKGDKYEFKIENSNSEEWTVASDSESIDNVSASLTLAKSVLPGQVGYDTISVYDDTLNDTYHLSRYDQITFKIHAFNDSWDKSFDTDFITITK